MVDASTQREPPDNKALPLSLGTGDQTICILRTSIRHRVKLHHTLQRAGRSGRTSEAAVPSGTKADDACSLCRPRNLSSKWKEERRGPDLVVRTSELPSPETSRPQDPIEEGSEGVSAVPVPFGTDTADVPTESPSHELQLHEQTQDVVAAIGAVLKNLPSIALDREAPFGGGVRSQVSRSHFRARSGRREKWCPRARFREIPALVRLGEAERTGLGRTRTHLGIWTAQRADFPSPFSSAPPISLLFG
eukprot:545367-Pleurochrysis_carterae.AAC.1